MDRLICGDVGYGKTEVALRAAHKAITDGKQVMMLVPTTILAQQHLGTFRERLAEFPIEVDLVSRLRSPPRCVRRSSRFGEGKVDILIGTHRLLSRDVRARDLGLLIVDEEQRFGVRQKELLRQLKLKVDVLSLSATPIPQHASDEPRRPSRHLGDRDATGGPPADPDLRRALRRGAGPPRHRAREGARRAGVLPAQPHRDPARNGRAAAGAVPGRSLRRGARADGGGRAGAHDARVPARRGRLPRRDDDHRVGPGHPAGQHPDRRARRRARARAGVPDPGRVGTLARARLRVPALSLRPGAQTGGWRQARDAARTTPSSGPASRSRCGTWSSAAPATCWATSSPGTLRRSGSSSTSRSWTTPSRSSARRTAPGRPEAAVRLDVDVDAYLPADYIPFEAAKIDVHRRISGAGEWASCGSCATSFAIGSAPCPSRWRTSWSSSAHGSSWACWGRGRWSSAADASRSPRSRWTRPPSRACARACRRRCTSPASRRSRCGCPDEPEARLAAVLGLAEAVRGAVPEPVAA